MLVFLSIVKRNDRTTKINIEEFHTHDYISTEVIHFLCNRNMYISWFRLLTIQTFETLDLCEQAKRKVTSVLWLRQKNMTMLDG